MDDNRYPANFQYLVPVTTALLEYPPTPRLKRQLASATQPIQFTFNHTIPTPSLHHPYTTPTPSLHPHTALLEHEEHPPLLEPAGQSTLAVGLGYHREQGNTRFPMDKTKLALQSHR